MNDDVNVNVGFVVTPQTNRRIITQYAHLGEERGDFHAHHVTMKFKMPTTWAEMKNIPKSMEFPTPVYADAIGYTENNVVALRTPNVPSDNQTAHLTVWVPEGQKPVMSNSIVKWEELKSPIQLLGKVDIFWGDYTKTKPFPSEKEAWEWLESHNLECSDNYRLGYYGEDSMDEYESALKTGCCGYFDRQVIIDGRIAIIGCNYGH